jgi:hypothetical protein
MLEKEVVGGSYRYNEVRAITWGLKNVYLTPMDSPHF